MSKAIFFNVPAYGHINPSLGLVSELVRRGEQVIYYATEEFHANIEGTGAEFRAYDNIPADLLEDVNGNPFILSVRMIDACALMLPELLEIVRAENPDYIIYDSMCPWGWQVAHHLNLPSVSSMGLFATSVNMFIKSGKFPALFMQAARNFGLLWKYNRKAAALERMLGVKAPSFVESLNSGGDLTLVHTSATFQPNADSFPKSYKFVGPSIQERNESVDFPFEWLGIKPLIYISMGTVNNDQLAFYRECLAAFDENFQVVMSIGNRVEMRDLGAIPENYIVRRYVPQLELLPAVDLFITHGGMNSVQEALYHKVPLIVIPQTMEQSIVGGQVAKLGAGVMLDKAKANRESLREAAYEVLDNGRYQSGATQLGESFKAAGGYRRATDEIFALLHKRVSVAERVQSTFTKSIIGA